MRFLAEAAQDFEAINAGEHNVEHYQIDTGLQGFIEAAVAFMGCFDGKAFAMEELAKQRGEFGVVIDQQDVHGSNLPRERHLRLQRAQWVADNDALPTQVQQGYVIGLGKIAALVISGKEVVGAGTRVEEGLVGIARSSGGAFVDQVGDQALGTPAKKWDLSDQFPEGVQLSGGRWKVRALVETNSAAMAPGSHWK